MKQPIPFGKFYLLERINVGGMAEVFRAKAYGVEGFERLLAVKRILPNIAEDQEFIEMFIDEAKIAVQLSHANIVQIFDLGCVDGSYFIAMEHILGRDLRAMFDRCRQLGEPLPVSHACFAVMKACEGLDYAHNKRDAQGAEMQLVHRDVSPQNVLVSIEGEVKLIDFGIAKAAGKANKTQAGILKGKFSYMSPEQVRGLPIDRRSDVFATGILLYELLTNERLFLGESDFSTLEKVRNVEILPPSTYNRDIPDELERIVLKALAKDVEDRYQNAIDLHDDLQAFVYTAGEFCSRKDLSTWIRRVFAKEFDEETKKLEEYSRMAPPDASLPRARPTTLPAGSRPRISTMPPPPAAAMNNGRSARLEAQGGGLDWDDDELDTQIYDTPEEAAAAAAAAKGGAPMNLGGHAHSGGLAAVGMAPGVATLRGFESPAPMPQGTPRRGPAPEPTAQANVAAHVSGYGSVSDPLDRGMTHPGGGSRTWIAVLSALFLVGGGFGGFWYYQNHIKQAGGATPAAGAGLADKTPAVGGGDPNTGFDIITDPVGAKVKLDGSDIGVSPLRVRGLPPGDHKLEVDGAPGFLKKQQMVNVKAGIAGPVKLVLDAVEVIATFKSEPPGAKVYLISDGQRNPLGDAPTTAKLDPRKRHEVVFEKRDYISWKKPITVGSDPAPTVVAVLEKERVKRGGRRDGKRDKPDRVELTDKPIKEIVLKEEVKVKTPSGKGTLLVGSKPSCKIFVDGKNTGKFTPQRSVLLSAGKHRITLVNNEYHINESYTVVIKPGETSRLIKTYTDRM